MTWYERLEHEQYERLCRERTMDRSVRDLCKILVDLCKEALR